MNRIWMLLAASILLSACAGTPEVTQQPVAPKIAKTAVELLFEIRTVALENTDALDVQPLDEPEVADLRQRGADLESSGDFAAAEQAYAQALKIVPDAPGLLQAQAEMLLVTDQLDVAEMVAARAYQLGPKLGPLCRRSWATIRWARELRGNVAAAQTASEQGERCATPPPVRM